MRDRHTPKLVLLPALSPRPVRRAALPLILVQRGMGALNQQDSSIASAAAAGASVTGVLIGSLLAIPVAGPIAAGIAALGVALANVFSGCGQTCVQASNIANQVGDILAQNLQTYMSAPIHYASMQAAALNNFDTAWASLVANCANPALAAAGQRCVTDRQRGACTWKVAEPFGWIQGSDGTWSYVPAGAADSNGTVCWNWFSGMRDPIANDPTVVPDPVPGATQAGSVLSAVGINPASTIAGVPLSELLLPGALILAALLLL
jgi:hypothetical protein